MCPKTTCASISETNKPKLTTQQVQPSLTIVVVQPCEVDKLLAAHLAAQNDLQRRDENGHLITTMLVKTFIMKPSHSLDTKDVHTILHISCFLQLLVSKLPSDRQSSLLCVSVCLLNIIFLEKTKQCNNFQQNLKEIGINS